MDNLEDIFGWVALALTMFIYISPTIPFFNVLRGLISYEETPGILVSATYVNCFCWYIYGDMIFSDQVKICNCIGAICSLCFITIYLVYEIKKIYFRCYFKCFNYNHWLICNLSWTYNSCR